MYNLIPSYALTADMETIVVLTYHVTEQRSRLKEVSYHAIYDC